MKKKDMTTLSPKQVNLEKKGLIMESFYFTIIMKDSK